MYLINSTTETKKLDSLLPIENSWAAWAYALNFTVQGSK